VLSRSEALRIALSEVSDGLTLKESDATELSNGWYFPLSSSDGEMWVGSHGLAVGKLDGAVMHFGSAYPVERDLRAYEAGMTRPSCDIRISRINDYEATLGFVQALRMTVVEPEFDGETTWRIPRKLRREELESSLSDLPHTFRNVGVYFVFEEIEAARSNNCCEFDLLAPLLPATHP